MATLRGSVPYPWPYDEIVDGSRLALIVAGAQRAWIDRSREVAAVTEVIVTVAAAVRACGGVVAAVRHVGANRRTSLPPAIHASEAALAFSLAPGDVEVVAHGVSGFYASPLDGMLRRRAIDHLVITGYGAEAAVDSTLRGANDRGFECLVLSDGVAPFDDDTGKRALSSVTMSGGIFGAIAPSADLLAVLHPDQ